MKQSDSFLSLLLNDIISEVQTTWRAIDLEYRIKYIFKGTRDKGHEIADCHGTYMLYDNMQREEMSSPPEYLEEGFEFPELPETEYLTFNKDNSQMRGMAKNATAYLNQTLLFSSSRQYGFPCPLSLLPIAIGSPRS